MVKKTIIWLVLYFFCSFTLLVFGKRIFCQGAGAGRSRVFLAPWSRSRSRSKKNTRSRSRSRLGKKSGAGAAWKKSGAGAAKKFAGSPALILSYFIIFFSFRHFHHNIHLSKNHSMFKTKQQKSIENVFTWKMLFFQQKFQQAIFILIYLY